MSPSFRKNMANDLYHKKDKMDLAQTNPRARSYGPLSSGDMQYKNYLAGMKPRPKTPEGHKESNHYNVSKNRLSATYDLKGDTQQIKTNLTTPKKTKNSRTNPKIERSKSTSFDEDSSVSNEPTVSVGKLCSMFDNVTAADNVHKPKLYNTNNDADRRAKLKRYSALEPIQRPKQVNGSDEVDMNLRVDVTRSNDTESASVSGKVNDESSKGLLNIDAMLSSDHNTEIDSGSTSETNSSIISETTENKNRHPEPSSQKSALPQSKTKGMHGLLQRKGSEFDDFEDRIVPTGTKTIDISSLIAPTPSSSDDGNHCNNDNSKKTESKQCVLADFDLQKKREIDRLMQAQQEVEIHKACNIKRRSLKDKLSEMCSMNQDSFDHGVVPYELANQPKDLSAINIQSQINQNKYPTPASIQEETSINYSQLHQGKNIDEKLVNCKSEIVSSQDKSDVNITSNDVPIKCSETIEKKNEMQVKVVTDSTIEKVGLVSTIDILKDVKNITADIGNVETISNEEHQTIDVPNIELEEIDKEKTNILLSDTGGSDSENDSEETSDKPYESVVERFDAFLTSHGMAELDPDILSPVPISHDAVDVKLAAVILDSYESAEPSLIGDETSNDTSDISIDTEKVSSDISSTGFSQKLSDHSDDISITDEVTSLMNSEDQGVESNCLLSNHELTVGSDMNAPVNTFPCKEGGIDLLHSHGEVSLEVDVSKVNALPNKLAVLDEMPSEEVTGVDHAEGNLGQCERSKDNIIVKSDSSEPNVITNAACISSAVPKLSDEKDACEIISEALPPSILGEVVSTTKTPVQNANYESTKSNSDSESTHQAHPTLDSSLTNDTSVIRGSTNVAVEKQKPSIVNEDICSESTINEVSADNDDNNQYQSVTRSIKPREPKKSNLVKSQGSTMKKVNFKEPLLNDVIHTYGPTEYDRANVDIDPIASSAEWELEKRVDKMDVFSVDLQKDERGLGLSIIGLGVGTETGVEKLGIFVKTLTENGASQKDGRIQVNDQILEVNGISLVGVTQYFAAQTLKNTDGVVRFLMGREKSQRTQYSPGAPLAGNPEMHKHIEEMNRLLVQLEEFEDRAMNAESTLEDVKVELLKAEERAHAVEQDLKETKEQLAAATESHFVGSTKKLKNEIKKRGGKHEKVDTLQQSLTDLTSKLSTSEDNLSELQIQSETKDNEIMKLQQQNSDLCSRMEEMEKASKLLHVEIDGKTGAINTAIMENEKLKEQLEKANQNHVTEKENLQNLKIELTAQIAPDLEEKQNKTKELGKENARLKDEIHALTERLQMNEELLKKLPETSDKGDHVNILECKLSECKTEIETLKANIAILKEKNEYLQSLIMKLERREELAPENIDKERKFKEKEEEYMKQIDALCERITELEKQLQFPKTVVDDPLSPALPIRGYVNIKEINQPAEPPEISRNTKPSVTIEANTELLCNINNSMDEDTNLLSNDSGVESINNIDEIECVSSPSRNTNTSTVHPSLNSSPNPVPKPERGNFIDIDFNSTSTHDRTGEPRELSPNKVSTTGQEDDIVPSSLTGPLSVDSSLEVDNAPTLIENINVGSTTEIITDNIPDLVTNKNISKINRELSFDLDDLPEGKIDTESDEDQGQFQLIHEEDIEEEQPTPGPVNRVIRLHSDITDDRMPLNADLNGSLITDSSFEKWLGRIDSTSREEEAAKIADQVAAGTPNMRKYSNTSSTSSDEEANISPNVAVVHVDSSYPEISGQSEVNFDMPTGAIDKAVNIEKESVDDDDDGDLKKSLSLDSAIPPTAILENKGALDKKALMNNQRAKPSRSPHVAVAAEGTVSGADGSETMTESSTLPRHGHKVQTKIKAAQSVPNLSMMPDADKPSKRKNKYVFNLPRAFKKSKIGKRLSHDSFNKRSKNETPSFFSDTDLTPVDRSRTSSDIDMHSYSQSLNVEVAVVPMEEKAESINQEKANDAATEEAVVPFADKEMMMTRRCSDTDLHTVQGIVNETSRAEAARPKTMVEDSDIRPYNNEPPPPYSPRPDTVIGQGKLTVDSPILHPKTNELEYEFSSYTASPSESPEFYNERGIDVEMGDVNVEENRSYKTQHVTHWDVKQVGQWLTEINMSEYVNIFKHHHVNGSLLLNADGRELKEYGVLSHEHRSQMKKYIKEFRLKYSKGSWQKVKDHKSTKDKLQFWKGKYKLN